MKETFNSQSHKKENFNAQEKKGRDFYNLT